MIPINLRYNYHPILERILGASPILSLTKQATQEGVLETLLSHFDSMACRPGICVLGTFCAGE